MSIVSVVSFPLVPKLPLRNALKSEAPLRSGLPKTTAALSCPKLEFGHGKKPIVSTGERRSLATLGTEGTEGAKGRIHRVMKKNEEENREYAPIHTNNVLCGACTL